MMVFEELQDPEQLRLLVFVAVLLQIADELVSVICAVSAQSDFSHESETV